MHQNKESGEKSELQENVPHMNHSAYFQAHNLGYDKLDYTDAKLTNAQLIQVFTIFIEKHKKEMKNNQWNKIYQGIKNKNLLKIDGTFYFPRLSFGESSILQIHNMYKKTQSKNWRDNLKLVIDNRDRSNGTIQIYKGHFYFKENLPKIYKIIDELENDYNFVKQCI